MSLWQLTVRGLTGTPYYVQVPNNATVLDVKKAVHQQDASILCHLQRLVGPGRKKLLDGSRLSECGIRNGTQLSLIILRPCVIYVQGVDGKMYTTEVPSSEPDDYLVSDLFVLVEKAVGHNMDDYMIHHQGCPVEKARHGRKMVLKDCGIKMESTLVLTKMGLMLDITNPKVDICFLVDCTASMKSHIEAVKKNIKQLRDKLVAEYKECDLLFAFVRYTDYDWPADSRTTRLDFTKKPDVFRDFVSGISAGGRRTGRDTPEDIMGGLKVAFQDLSWRSSATKILIHIADRPCHGEQYHHRKLGDNYPRGDPAGISHESMMQRVVDLEIQYWFGYILRQYTDKMIRIFNDSLRSLSNQRSIIRQFDAIQPSDVGEAVKKSVTASVYGSAALKKAAVHIFRLDPDVPDWNTPSITQQLGTKTPPPAIKSLKDLQYSDFTLEAPRIGFTFKIAPDPFAEGSDCVVYHGSDLTNFQRIVLKRFKRSAPEYNTLDCYMKELMVRTISAVYAREFNTDKMKPSNTCSIEFTPLDIVKSNDETYYMLETFLSSKIEKFGNNFGVVVTSPWADTLQAFSHFSWVKSGKTLLICDLQGFKEGGKNQITLTDPAIHSSGPAGKFGAMDAGMDGIKAFFNTHTCSSVCRLMDLESHRL